MADFSKWSGVNRIRDLVLTLSLLTDGLLGQTTAVLPTAVQKRDMEWQSRFIPVNENVYRLGIIRNYGHTSEPFTFRKCYKYRYHYCFDLFYYFFIFNITVMVLVLNYYCCYYYVISYCHNYIIVTNRILEAVLVQ